MRFLIRKFSQLLTVFRRWKYHRRPDFFLISFDNYLLEAPRKCWKQRYVTLADDIRCVVIRLDPPITIRMEDRSCILVEIVVLAPRIMGLNFVSISSFWHYCPALVHVLIHPRNETEVRTGMHAEEFINICWAELFPDMRALTKSSRQYQPKCTYLSEIKGAWVRLLRAVRGSAQPSVSRIRALDIAMEYCVSHGYGDAVRFHDIIEHCDHYTVILDSDLRGGNIAVEVSAYDGEVRAFGTKQI